MPTRQPAPPASQMALPQWVSQHKLPLLGAAVGLFLMVAGIWQAVGQYRQDSKVEIVSQPETSEQGETNDEIVVDVGGAVQEPGVYSFSGTPRINDALVSAGGLSADADRVWVARFINRAAKLEDGMKLYLPFQGESDSDSKSLVTQTTGNVAGISQTGTIGSTTGININNASVSQLDTLWGIGEVRAQQIVDNRPYSNIEELMTKAGIPKNVFGRIKDKVSLN